MKSGVGFCRYSVLSLDALGATLKCNIEIRNHSTDAGKTLSSILI
jgi:hypothetical protein